MGIVAHCPNGHRTKVRDHLAGKRVRCPTCEATMRVPAAPVQGGEQRPAGGDAATASAPALPPARFIPLDPAVIATLPRALPFGTARPAAATAAATAAEREEEAEFILCEAEEVAPPPWHAAIADRPDLTWRIAYPGGEASEPVDAATLQEWLAAGQADGSELVWRADWTEWRPVHEVFPDSFAGA